MATWGVKMDSWLIIRDSQLRLYRRPTQPLWSKGQRGERGGESGQWFLPAPFEQAPADEWSSQGFVSARAVLRGCSTSDGRSFSQKLCFFCSSLRRGHQLAASSQCTDPTDGERDENSWIQSKYGWDHWWSTLWTIFGCGLERIFQTWLLEPLWTLCCSTFMHRASQRRSILASRLWIWSGSWNFMERERPWQSRRCKAPFLQSGEETTRRPPCRRCRTITNGTMDPPPTSREPSIAESWWCSPSWSELLTRIYEDRQSSKAQNSRILTDSRLSVARITERLSSTLTASSLKQLDHSYVLHLYIYWLTTSLLLVEVWKTKFFKTRHGRDIHSGAEHQVVSQLQQVCYHV